MKLEKRIASANRRGEPRTARRGFSIILVLSSMLFLGIAIMGMTTLFAHEVRRTRTALAEAQLRQLLLAAVPAAQEQLRANTATRDVPLTVPIEEATVNLHIANSTVTVEAHLRGFKATQTLQFDNGKLISATLTQTAGQ